MEFPHFCDSTWNLMHLVEKTEFKLYQPRFLRSGSLQADEESAFRQLAPAPPACSERNRSKHRQNHGHDLGDQGSRVFLPRRAQPDAACH